MKYLVLASSENELKFVHESENVYVREIGVGLSQSAVNASFWISELNPDVVILVGFCGAVSEELKIGDVASIGSFVLYDMDLRAFRLKRGEMPSVNRTVLGRIGTSGGEYVCGSSDRFLTRGYRENNPWIRDELNVDVSDMEGYSVCLAARRSDKKFYAFRVVSDDSQGHRPGNYRKFMDDACESLAECVLGVIRQNPERNPL